MELIRRFPSDSYTHALEAWAWVPNGLVGKAPLFTSAFGDVFLLSDNGVWLLDSI